VAFTEYEKITINLNSSSNIYLFQKLLMYQRHRISNTFLHKKFKRKHTLFLHLFSSFACNFPLKTKTKQSKTKKLGSFSKLWTKCFPEKETLHFEINLSQLIPGYLICSCLYLYIRTVIWKKLCADKYWSFLWMTKYVCIIVRWVLEFLTIGDKIS
jgi:hypothetical protein